jgi:hypothetical protein
MFSSMRIAIRAIVTILALSLVSVGEGTVRTLKSGDILVVDALTGVIRIDPVTGTQTVVSQGGFLNTSSNSAVALALEADGQILVLDVNITLAGGVGIPGIVRIDPTTGVQTLVTTGVFLSNPTSIAVELDEQIVVVDRAGVIRVDPVTGTQTLVTTDGELSSPQGITVVPKKLEKK